MTHERYPGVCGCISVCVDLKETGRKGVPGGQVWQEQSLHGGKQQAAWRCLRSCAAFWWEEGSLHNRTGSSQNTLGLTSHLRVVRFHPKGDRELQVGVSTYDRIRVMESHFWEKELFQLCAPPCDQYS